MMSLIKRWTLRIQSDNLSAQSSCGEPGGRAAEASGMAKVRAKRGQVELVFRTHGGASHRTRPEHDPRHPVHVTLRVVGSAAGLRRKDMYLAIREATSGEHGRGRAADSACDASGEDVYRGGLQRLPASSRLRWGNRSSPLLEVFSGEPDERFTGEGRTGYVMDLDQIGGAANRSTSSSRSVPSARRRWPSPSLPRTPSTGAPRNTRAHEWLARSSKRTRAE
jgi:hypothetical protein